MSLTDRVRLEDEDAPRFLIEGYAPARIGIAAVVLLAMLLPLATPPDADEETRRLLEILGIDAPARPMIASSFSLPDLNGTWIRLSALQGQIVMLYFWTTW